MFAVPDRCALSSTLDASLGSQRQEKRESIFGRRGRRRSKIILLFSWLVKIYSLLVFLMDK